MPVEIDRTTRLDWDALRAKAKRGMRNATLMAIAPTASIGLVAGTTPGLDPQFSQLFSRATSSGKFLEVNRNLVAALQERGLWEQVREDLLRSQGDISGIAAIPDEIKRIYRTSFQQPPEAFLEVAGRAQKWIDQAISRNMYLSTRDVGDMVRIYSDAWKRGLKTTYYLHMQPRHSAEQSTVKVEQVRDDRPQDRVRLRHGGRPQAGVARGDGRRSDPRRGGGGRDHRAGDAGSHAGGSCRGRSGSGRSRGGRGCGTCSVCARSRVRVLGRPPQARGRGRAGPGRPGGAPDRCSGRSGDGRAAAGARRGPGLRLPDRPAGASAVRGMSVAGAASNAIRTSPQNRKAYR